MNYEATTPHQLWPGRGRDGSVHSIGLLYWSGMAVAGIEEEKPRRKYSGERITIQCKRCGCDVQTTDTRWRRTYCDPCRKVRLGEHAKIGLHKQEKLLAGEVRTCVICGKKYSPWRPVQVTCSQDCSYARQLHMARENSKRKYAALKAEEARA